MIRMIWRETQTIASSALVAALLWLYAEGATVKPQKITLDLNLTEPKGRHLLIDPPSLEVTLMVPCTSTQYVHLQSLDHKPFALELPDDAPDQKLNLHDLLLADRRFASLGIREISAQPETVAVKAVALVTVPLRVQPRYGDLEFVTGAEPKASPSEVDVLSVPADLARRLQPDDAVIADIDVVKARKQADNIAQNPQVPLTLPPLLRGTGARLSTDTATVAFTLRSGTAQLTLESLRVAPTYSSDDFNATIDITQYPPKVELRGPREAIADLASRIKSAPSAQSPVIYGSVLLTGDDLAKPGTITKPIDEIVGLPLGVTPVLSLPSVQVIIKRIPVVAPPAAAAPALPTPPPFAAPTPPPPTATSLPQSTQPADFPPPATAPSIPATSTRPTEP